MEAWVAPWLPARSPAPKNDNTWQCPVLGTKGISRPGIGSKVGNALLSVCRAVLAVCARICLGIVKELGEAILSVIKFVVEVIVETLIELRWFLLIGLSLMALLWLWMQNDPHRSRSRPYHADPAQGWISR